MLAFVFRVACIETHERRCLIGHFAFLGGVKFVPCLVRKSLVALDTRGGTIWSFHLVTLREVRTVNNRQQS